MKKNNKAINRLKQVIDGGYCIGCGVCAHVTKQAIHVERDGFQKLQAILNEDDLQDTTPMEQAAYVCPFSDYGENEDEIGLRLYGGLNSDPALGYWHKLWIGHQRAESVRARVTSGGIITWVATKLLKEGHIDKVIHVKPGTNPSEGLFYYQTSETCEEILEGSKSRYYPITLSKILKEIENNDSRYLLIALPCFLKSVRNLQKISPLFNERIVYTIGLICGHLKSGGFSELLSYQLGVTPDDINTVDFRVKNSKSTADDYSFSVSSQNKVVTAPTKNLYGTNWGLNFFRYPACNYCDDVYAECGDLTVGDAWLPDYMNDGLGNSMVLSRSVHLSGLLESGIEAGELKLDVSSPSEFKQAQAGGIRDRREGLAYRLHLKNIKNEWAPKKRFEPESSSLTPIRKRIYRTRIDLEEDSHRVWLEAKKSNDLEYFERTMRKKTNSYYDLYLPTWKRMMVALKLRSIAGWVKNLLK